MCDAVAASSSCGGGGGRGGGGGGGGEGNGVREVASDVRSSNSRSNVA